MPTIRIEAKVPAGQTTAILQDKLIHSANKRRTLQELITYLQRIAGGVTQGSYLAQICGGTYASESVNCDYSDAVDGTDTITIGPVTLSVEAAPATEDEFDSGADDADFADNLAAAINAHSVLKNIVSAESDGVSDVTITSRLAGQIGNCITLAEAGNGFTLGAAVLSGGTENDAVEFGLGLSV